MTLANLARPAPDRTDAAAIALSLDSAGAFAAVFERHHPAVHRYLSRRLGTDLADELAAETFAVAFARRGRYDGGFADARPWLFGIATRLAHRHWRREERELRAYARTGVDAVAPAADEGAAARADSAGAGPAIAAALSISPGTVKSRLHRARTRLRQSLAGAGGLDPLRLENHE